MESTMQDVPLAVASIVRHGVTRHGDATVLTLGPEPRRSTFAEVGDRIAMLANVLQDLGVGPGDRVATFMWNNQEHLEAYTAVPSMGAVVHTVNVRLAPEQVAYIVNHAEDKVVVLDASLADAFAEAMPKLHTVEAVLVAGTDDVSPYQDWPMPVLAYEELMAAASAGFDWPSMSEYDAAAMCYTSGTTGNPKGVVYSHRSTYLHTLSVCTGNALGMSYRDRLLAVVPMFHASAWGWPYAAFASGADLVLPDRMTSPETIVRVIEDERVTITGGVPTVWHDVMAFLDANPGHDLSSLRVILCGGSPVPRSLIESYRDKLGVTLLQAWGMTEMSPLGSLAWPPKGVGQDEATAYALTQGRMLVGVDARVVDDDKRVLPNDGESTGEVQVRGPWITGSYYRHEGDEFHDGWLRTGDVGSLDALGYLRLTDRSKDVIKSGGEWISSVELENCLIAHPEVMDAAVIGIPDERWQERPLAVVALSPGSGVGPAHLQEWLADRVAKWWLPEYWALVDAVPRTSVGKTDKKRLRERYADDELTVQKITEED